MDQTAGRIQLATLLATAAEVEHALTCQYLYGAFSMKRSYDEGGVTYGQLEKMRLWEAWIMLIARQEMEHLGLVCNLLTAIGEAPNFQRPGFPVPVGALPLDEPFELIEFGAEFLQRAICYERPDNPSASHLNRCQALMPDRSLTGPHTIAALYDEIRQLFETLEPRRLFIGPPGAQLTNRQVIPVPVVGVSPFGRAIYEVQLAAVTDRPSAIAAVDQIIKEGEGTSSAREDSHFGRFLTIYEQFQEEQASGFTPARPVLRNPQTTETVNATAGGHVITNRTTRPVAQLFDLIYGTLMLILIRFFAQTDETETEAAALQRAAFFPMMTTAIRPLGEVLTMLPALDDGSDVRAGAPFQFTRRLGFLPHPRAAWTRIHQELVLAADQARSLWASAAYPTMVHERLEILSQNLERIALNFAQEMHLEGS